MKDWSGNKNSVFKTLGASNHAKNERESNDYYATDPIAIDKLVSVYDLPHTVWECACGAGHLSKRLEELGHSVYATDFVDRGFGESGIDFLKTRQMPLFAECILTNPPYKYATEFVLHSLDLLPVGGVCIMLLRTLFLEGQERYEKIYKNHPPHFVYQFSKRLTCAKGGVFNGTGAVAYAFFIWEKGYKGDTIVRWL